MTCPDCNKPIPAIGKHIHRCRPQSSYVVYFDGHELPGFYRTEQRAQSALNDYVWHLIQSGLILTNHERQVDADQVAETRLAA